MKAVTTQNLGKKFKIFTSPINRLVEILTLGQRKFHTDFWAIRSINLEIEKGLTVGIVGANGAGKSTLLKVLVGITAHSEGSFEVRGRVSGLLELGAGFHPEFSGRDNIMLSCSLMGMSKAEALRKQDEIIEFSELGEYIDQPVKHYSSGMYMRLGFSVASCVDPDILVVDEALSVGDEYFTSKCLDRFRDFRKRGKTIILVTHFIKNVRLLCDRAFLMEKGQLLAQGDPDRVSDEYLERLSKRMERKADLMSVGHASEGQGVSGTGEIEINEISIHDGQGRPQQTFNTGEAIEIRAKYAVKSDVNKPLFGLQICREDGTVVIAQCMGMDTLVSGKWKSIKELTPLLSPRSKGQNGHLSCYIEHLPLHGGTYFFHFWIFDYYNNERPTVPILRASHRKFFSVRRERVETDAQYYCPARWVDSLAKE